MTERRIRIVWPFAGYVPESKIRNWFWEAIEDGLCLANDGETLRAMCITLSDIGIIILHRDWESDL